MAPPKLYPVWGPFPDHWGEAPPRDGVDTSALRAWIEENATADELAAGYRSSKGSQLSARAAARILAAKRDPP